MYKFSLSNKYLNLNLNQFRAMTNRFHEVIATVTQSQNTYLQIRGFNRAKVYAPQALLQDKHTKLVLEEYSNKTFMFLASETCHIWPERWASATYLEVMIMPSGAICPVDALAWIGFKGLEPKQATFYMPEENHKVREAMAKLCSRKVLGDGQRSNAMELYSSDKGFEITPDDHYTSVMLNQISQEVSERCYPKEASLERHAIRSRA